MELALEEIQVLAVAFGGELLHLHADLAGERLQIFMIGVDELAAQFAEHALVEVVLGEHAAAPAIARLEQDRRRAGLLETIGGSQPGNATADDGNRAPILFLILFGVGAPVEHRRQGRRPGRGRRESQQSPSRQRGCIRKDETLVTERIGQSFRYGGEQRRTRQGCPPGTNSTA
jgi:hypothetical protein